MLKKILLALPIAAILVVAGIYFYANYAARQQIDTRLEQAVASGSYQELEYESVQVHFNGDLTMTNLKVVDLLNNEYILESIEVRDFDFEHEIPWHMSLTASGMRFPQGLPQFTDLDNPVLSQYLETLLEDDTIPIILNYNYDYQPDDNYLLTSNVGIGLVNAMNLNVKSVSYNIPLDAFAADPNQTPEVSQMQLMGALMSAEIPEFSVAFEDLGILDAWITLQSTQSRLSPADFRAMLISQAQNLYLIAPETAQTLAQNFGTELAEFLEGNKTLNISIEPELGGSIQQLQPQIMGAAFTGDFNQIASLLNLTVSTQ